MGLLLDFESIGRRQNFATVIHFETRTRDFNFAVETLQIVLSTAVKTYVMNASATLSLFPLTF